MLVECKFSKVPLSIVLSTLKRQNKDTGLNYFLVFVHHSTFRLPSLQGYRTKQQTATVIFSYGNFVNMNRERDAVCLLGLQGL